ncbi:MAG: ribbon-helix-helix protein, CopG family [Actinobacteria bacterium]|nr:ribbon-helix-helix protein, CopG family [Actinomycetota bacterium]
MATNLRLSEAAAKAVKAEAKRSGRSQQDIIREAVDRYLAAPERDAVVPERSSLRDIIIPPRTPFKHDIVPIDLPEGVTSLDLLDREDRF